MLIHSIMKSEFTHTKIQRPKKSLLHRRHMGKRGFCSSCREKIRPHSNAETCKKNDPIHSLIRYCTIPTQTMQIKFIITQKRHSPIYAGNAQCFKK